MTAIELIQGHLGVPKSGHWDGMTMAALAAYQSSHGLDATGHPDPATLASLGYYKPEDIFTKKWAEYLSGGDKPGTFGRDLKTSIDQVPRWVWGTVAAGFSVFAIMAYRTDRKREKRA
jgi:peptidoglycan hydrolase-like protein with peptidoglycan-binding domain